jgi:hypothetical protein
MALRKNNEQETMNEAGDSAVAEPTMNRTMQAAKEMHGSSKFFDAQ